MSKILQMDRAAFERLVDDRLRAAHDTQSGTVNTRAGQETVEQPIVDADGLTTSEPSAQFSGAWRGAVAPNASRRSTLKPEQARNVMTWFRAFVDGDRQAQRAAMEALGQRTSLQSVGVSADGGATLPALFSSEVLIDLPKVTPFASPGIVRIIPMDNETLRWTKVTARPNNPTSVKEGAQYTKTGVSFAPITLVAKKIGEIIPFTEEILTSNAIGMVGVISELVADAFAFKYNALVTSGLNNADEPEGVLTNGDSVSTPFVNTSDQTKADSLIDIYHSMPSQYRATGPIWLLNDLDIARVRKLKDTLGRYLWVDGFGVRPDTLLGRPVFENPDLPQGTVLFGNFLKGYVIGMREGMTIQVNSSGTDWEKDITNYKFRQRWDGRVHDAKAFVKGTGLS